MSSPRVSILMATNSCDGLFRLALASCLEQSFPDFELVLVVNGVSDDTFLQIREHCGDPRIRLYRTDMRYLQFSLNLGLHFRRGELVARMDADDVAYPQRLARQVGFMDAHPDVAVCGSFCDLVDDRGQIVGRRTYPLDDAGIRALLYRDNPLCHPSVMYRRAHIVHRGGYQGYARAEDYYLWSTLAQDDGIVFANIPENLIAYRTESNAHPRVAARRQARAAVAATQLQFLLATGDFRWLPGMLRSIRKVLSLALRKKIKRIQ